MEKETLKAQLSASYDVLLDKSILNPDLVDLLEAYSSVKMIPFGSLFSGLISATASICCKSILKMHPNLKGLEAFDVAMTFYVINVGMASSNKSSCTSLFKAAYRKMERFLDLPSVLDNSATIEGLIEFLAKSENQSAYELWDELATWFESFGLYKAGGGNYDKSHLLTLYNGPEDFDHSCKKYNYHIENPRLSVFANSHPTTVAKYCQQDMHDPTAFISRFIIATHKGSFERLDKVTTFKGKYHLDEFLGVMQVIYSKPAIFILDTEQKTKLSDIFEQYDNISTANEVDLPYISQIYGKSKTHLARFIGCLWALEITFKVIAMLDPIPTEKDAFAAAVSEKYALIQEPNVVSLAVVEMASSVNNFFIRHKLILCNLELDKTTGEFKYLYTPARKENSKLSSENFSEKRKSASKDVSLALRILQTPGQVVFCTPLVKSHHADPETFKAACETLASKKLGFQDSFLPSSTSSRKANGFSKAIPLTSDMLSFTNRLLEFDCTYDEYIQTLQQKIIPPPQSSATQKKNNKENQETKPTSSKRALASTSIQNIMSDSRTKVTKHAPSTKDDDEDDDDDDDAS